MADDGPLSPEEQLLRLIEGKGSGKERAGLRPAGGALFSFAALRGFLSGKLSFWKRATGKRLAPARRAPRLDLAVVNRILMIAVAAVAAYLIGDAAFAVALLNKPPDVKVDAAEIPTGSARKLSPLQESSYYLEKVTHRDLFREGGKPKAEETSKVVAVDPGKTATNFSLVGISWSANPDAIIEDKSDQRTYFVKRGQTVGENTKVEAIFKDHVVLSREGEEFELR